MKSTKNPCSGPVGFWFLNDRLEPAIIDFQLDEFKTQGFSGVVLHPRDGLETPYLSETWFQAVEHILDGCTTRGLQAWFYDDNPFPSGSAGGRVLNQYPDLVARMLTFHSLVAEPKNGRISLPLPGTERLLRVFAFPVDKREAYTDITRYAGLVADRWYVQGERTQGYGPTFVDDTNHPHWRAWNDHETWTLDWPVRDHQTYQILVVRIVREADAHHGYYVDLLNPQTTQRFIEITHDETLKRLGPDRFRKFAAAFLDESHIPGPYPWTEALPREYQNAYQEPLLDLLPHLAVEIDGRSSRIRYQYRQLLGQLWEANFAQPLSQWYKEQGLPFTGHISPEEDPILATLGSPGLTRLIRQMDWPGYDLVLSPFGSGEGAKLIGPKLVSSIAHQQNKAHLMTEALGCCGEDLTLGTMRKMIDWLAIHGFDQYVLHGQFYSLDGHRKREAPPSIFYQAPYWQFFRHLSHYIDDRSQWLIQGKPHRPIAVLYPTVAFSAWVPVENTRAVRLARHLGELTGRLMAAGLDFDFVADADLASAEITPATFRIGHASYTTLVLPDVSVVAESTRTALQKLSDSGVTVESLTRRIMSVDRLDSVLDFPQIHSSLERLTRTLVRKFRSWLTVPADAKVYVHSRRVDDRIERLVWNPGDQPLRLVFADSAMELEPWQTVLVHDGLRPPKSPVLKPDLTARWGQAWSLVPQDPNLLLLTRWQLHLPDGTAHVVRLPARTGTLPWGLDHQTVRLWCEILVEDRVEDPELWFDRSTFAGPYAIQINGIPLGPAEPAAKFDLFEYRIPVGDVLKVGLNRIEITVGPVLPHQPAVLDPLRLYGRFKVIRTDNRQAGAEAADVRPDWYKSLCADDPSLAKITSLGPDLTLAAPTDWTTLGFPQYSGTMIYSNGIEIEDLAPRRFFAASNRQVDAFEVIVNGSSAGICAWSPFRLEITDYLRPGPNALEIKVANTSINRIEGKPQASGLFGPVEILVEKPIGALKETIHGQSIIDSVNA